MAKLREDITAFIDGDEGALRALLIMSAAESSTDALAIHLLAASGWPATQAGSFVDAVHGCDFVLEQNCEWSFAPNARRALIEALTSDDDLSQRVHTSLVELATEEGNSRFDGNLPQYLHSPVGYAYHGAFLDRADALETYALIGEGPRSGQQWLAGRLAQEQVELGVIPSNAIEVLFLRGMVLYREGRIADAAAVLRRVVARADVRREVALAAHILGHISAYEADGDHEAVGLLERSVELGEMALGAEHPQTLNSQIRLGIAYHAAGDVRRAIDVFEDTLEAQRRVLGPDHPQTLEAQEMLALAYQGAGDSETSLRLFELTLAARERVFGREDLQTVMTRWNLGNAYTAVGNVIRGKLLRDEALTIAQERFPSHPTTAEMLMSLRVPRKS